MANKKSKITSQKLMISTDTIEDCVSSWLTATGFIRKNQIVTFLDYIAAEGKYEVTVEDCDATKENAKEA